MHGARVAARLRGYHVETIDRAVVGEASAAARALVERVRGIVSRTSRPACIIASGETTVTLPLLGSTGRGGRNQELALAFALAFGDRQPYMFASVGTDGIDGPTDAAGAIVDDGTLARAQSKSLDAASALQAHDSYRFFAALGDHVVTGPTGTNVGDLQVFLTSESSR